MAPSVTPAVTQKLASNPSVRLYTYADLSKTHLDNYQQFYMDLGQANTQAQWITFGFGGLFEWLCLVSSVSCRSLVSPSLANEGP